VSSIEKGFGVLKNIMLMRERFELLDKRIETVSDDLDALGSSHAKLAERVASIEGYIRGRSDQMNAQGRLAGPDA